MLFIGEDGDGNVGGMVSRVKENIPNSFVSVEHYGIIENGQEVTSGPQIDLWGGAIESYGFSEKDGKTLVTVDMDSIKEFKTYFEESWPKALKLLKEICEK
ncbi:hypothetical protein EG832_20515 [bacterium]|nr:hypothetical protein [bacterium]